MQGFPPLSFPSLLGSHELGGLGVQSGGSVCKRLEPTTLSWLNAGFGIQSFSMCLLTSENNVLIPASPQNPGNLRPGRSVQWKRRGGSRTACSAPYLHLIKEGPHSLQWYWDTSETAHGEIGHFNQPFTKLFCHLPVALPLADLAVDDASPLLGPANHSLPLIAEEGQLAVELIPGEHTVTEGNTLLSWM